MKLRNQIFALCVFVLLAQVASASRSSRTTDEHQTDMSSIGEGVMHPEARKSLVSDCPFHTGGDWTQQQTLMEPGSSPLAQIPPTAQKGFIQ